MIIALNMLLVVVVLLLLYAAYRFKKVWPVLVAIAFVVVYTAAQPSYLPKGTVKAYIPPAFNPVNTPIVDRVLKPKSPDQYDAERNAQIEQINTSIKDAIQKTK